MKPISVEFQAFGPYEKKEYIDFESIYKAGLFLIDGKTGSGKTMILDAITFALYGKSSGANRDDLSQLRCSHCDPKDDTYVKYVFEEKGIRYIFERRLEMKRKNLAYKCRCLRIDENGIEAPLFENCKDKLMTQKAEEIIGLSFDQFRQVIILPQGKFEKLLTSDSKEKEAILESIFDSAKWKKIALKYYEKADNDRNQVNALKSKIDVSLSEEKCDSLQELENCISDHKNQLAQEEETFTSSNYDNRKKELMTRQALAKEFETMAGYDSQLKELAGMANEIKIRETSLHAAENAEELRVYMNDLDASAKRLAEREKERISSEKKVSQAETRLREVTDKFEAHKENKNAFQENSIKKTELELKKEIYESIEDHRNQLSDAKRRKKKTEEEKSECEAARNKVLSDLTAAEQELRNAENTEQITRSSYLSGITGYIAKDLQDGSACPVCGSIHHPKPAMIPEGSADAKAVEKAEKDVKDKREKWNKTDKVLKQADEKLKIKSDQLAEAAAAFEGIKALVDSEKKNLVPGIETLSDLNSELTRITIAIKEYNDEEDKLNSDLETAKNELITANNNKASSQAEYDKAEAEENKNREVLTEQISKSSFDSEEDVKNALMNPLEIKSLREEISRYYTRKAEYEKLKLELSDKLSGQTAPDSKAIEKELGEIDEAVKNHNTNKGKISGEIKRLDAKYENLSKDNALYEAAIARAESNYTFAKLLRGDTGVGLQRYVLGIMFSSVIYSANQMLKNVAGGRYTLFRTSEKTDNGNKRGLDLKVIDNCGGSPEGRSVSTLSGGEKFLASLALSIGLAGIAKTGGVNIEGIFIDEGFGTLDDDSINDALDILKSVQKDNGLVGIISHVELLRSAIYPQIRVKVDDTKSSHIEIC